MSTEANIAKIELTLNDNKTISARLPITNSSLIITDELIQPLVEKYGDSAAENIRTCDITIGANRIAVCIRDYTFTKTVSVGGYYNVPSNISIFQSRDTDVHITDQQIDLLQVDCEKVLLANCEIDQVDLGLVKHSEALATSSRERNNCLPTAHKMKSVDFRNCRISSVYAYIECNNINIQRSSIDILNFIGGFGSSAQTTIERVQIWQYSEIGSCEIHCYVSDFILEESNVKTLSAKAKCKIMKLTMKDAIITNAYQFGKRHFTELDLSAWTLISKSASNTRDFNAKSEANYKIAQATYQTETGANRIVNWFFDICSGYGYKPIRVLVSFVCLIALSTVLYTIADCAILNVCSLNSLPRNIVYALSALAGQSGLTIEYGAKFWIATTEYILGVILFAVFVNAMYVRYKD